MGFTTRRALPPRDARRARRPRLGALRPRHPAGDPEALPRLAARSVLARAGAPPRRAARARRSSCGRHGDPTSARVRPGYADALGGRGGARARWRRGHWTWHDRPELVERAAAFLAPASRLALSSSCCAPCSPPSRRRLAPRRAGERAAPARARAGLAPTRLVAADRRWQAAPVLLALAVRDRLPDLAAAHGRPGGAHLPRRAVRRGGLHDLERPVVRRSPHARLQRSSRRRSPGCWPRRSRSRSPPWRRRRCSRPSRAATSATSARAGARSGSASAPPRCCSRAGCRSRSAWRSAWRRCSRCSAAATRWRSCSPCSARSAARWPGCSWRWRAWRTRSPSGATGRSAARASRSRPPRSSRRSSSPGRSPRAAGRRSPSPPTADPAVRARLPRSCCRARRARCAGAPPSTASGATLALVLETPMGGNAVRLGALFGGPVLLCALWGRPWTRAPVAACRCSRSASPRSPSGSGRPPCAT